MSDLRQLAGILGHAAAAAPRAAGEQVLRAGTDLERRARRANGPGVALTVQSEDSVRVASTQRYGVASESPGAPTIPATGVARGLTEAVLDVGVDLIVGDG